MKTQTKFLALLIGGLLFLLKDQIMKLIGTRGVRNNNPFNIKLTSDNWNGSINGNDETFVTFKNPYWGIRAGAIILMNYEKNYNIKTIDKLINRFAPNSENNTQAYINAVSKAVGVLPHQEISIKDNLLAISKAIIHHENGYPPYSDIVIQEGVNLALS